MNCFECANEGRAVAAVAVCPHCGVGLCPDHLVEAGEYRVGGTTYGCPHTPRHTERRRTGRERAATA